MKEEMSKSGSVICRYTEKVENNEVSFGDELHLRCIESHVENYFGEITNVLHEIISQYVHLDILYVEPTQDKPFHLFVTSGMSNLPMKVPNGLENAQYAEIMIALPPEWKVSNEDFIDYNNYWPIQVLKSIARLPHEYNTWIGTGHTIPNGDPEIPFSDNTCFTGVIVLPPVEINKEFWSLSVSDNKTISFYALYPLYKEEMKLKLDIGLDELIKKFDKHKVSFILNLNRENTYKTHS